MERADRSHYNYTVYRKCRPLIRSTRYSCLAETSRYGMTRERVGRCWACDLATCFRELMDTPIHHAVYTKVRWGEEWQMETLTSTTKSKAQKVRVYLFLIIGNTKYAIKHKLSVLCIHPLCWISPILAIQHILLAIRTYCLFAQILPSCRGRSWWTWSHRPGALSQTKLSTIYYTKESMIVHNNIATG